MSLEVQLWKTGALWDYLQADTKVTKPSGTYLPNQGTFVNCANGTNSSFYGIAYASITIVGTTYSAAVQSPSTVSLGCGT